MWDLPGPGIEPMSPALAGGFLTTAPPGKSSGTGLKVILIIWSLKVISPFLLATHKTLPVFFFKHLTKRYLEKVWMDIVLIIQLLHETAIILLCLWILWVSFRAGPAEMACLLHNVWGLSERRLTWLEDGSSVGFCTRMSGAWLG